MDETIMLNEFKSLIGQYTKLNKDKKTIESLFIDPDLKIAAYKNLEKNLDKMKRKMHKYIDSIEPIYVEEIKENKNIDNQEQSESIQRVNVSSKKKEKTPYMIWHDDVSEKVIGIYDRSISYKMSKDVLTEIYEKITNVYGIVWEQDYKEWRRTNQGVPRTLNIIFNNEQYKSIFESILSDKYDEAVASRKDVLSPYELMAKLIEIRNDKSNGGVATLRMLYGHMENIYGVKWGRMISKFEKEKGRSITSKKELLYWNHGLVERFRLSVWNLVDELTKIYSK